MPVIVPKTGDLEYIIKDGVDGFIFNNDKELKQIVNNTGALNNSDKQEMSKRAVENISRNKYQDLAEKTLIAYNIK